MKTAHPYAAVFPLLPDAELRKLADDIKANGLLYPLVVDQQDRLVDGRNREKACELVGVKPSYNRKEMTDDQVLRLVTSANLLRRHLNESQRGMIADDLANVGKHSNQHQTKVVGPTGSNHSDSPPPVTQNEAAQKMNVHPSTVKRARKVKNKGTPELQQAIRDGEVSLRKGEQIIKLPKEEQNEELEKSREKKKSGPKVSQENGEIKSRGKGVSIANEAINWLQRIPSSSPHRKFACEAINCLVRIPKNDQLRKRGFQIVTDWIRHHP